MAFSTEVVHQGKKELQLARVFNNLVRVFVLLGLSNFLKFFTKFKLVEETVLLFASLFYYFLLCLGF